MFYLKSQVLFRLLNGKVNYTWLHTTVDVLGRKEGRKEKGRKEGKKEGSKKRRIYHLLTFRLLRSLFSK
jgi:hypothetical protein